MKELSIEEKAKAYDEALKAALVAHKDEDRHLKATLERIFPELKESEDERIREKLIDTFNFYDPAMNSPFLLGIHKKDILAWFEKQGEQMSADKVEPKFRVKYAGSEYNVFETKDIAGVTFYGIEDEPNHIDYVKAESCEIISGYGIKESGSPYPTKPVMFSEQKPTDKDEPKEDNRPVTERIKTFEDALEALGDEHPLVKEYWGVVRIDFDISKDLYAYLKLRVIVAALNEGWEPKFEKGECRYYPWFYLFTKEQYDKLDDERKGRCVLCSGYNTSANYGVVYSNAFYDASFSFSSNGSRLVFKTYKLAEYAGRQFTKEWANFVFKTK